MTSTFDNENPLPELQDDNKLDGEAVIADAISSTSTAFFDKTDKIYENHDFENEFDYEYEEDYEEEKKLRPKELWQYSENAFNYFPITEEDAESEEEEEHPDIEGYEFSLAKYDLIRFRDDILKDEKRQEVIAKLKELHSETKVLFIVNKFLHKQYINANRNSPALSNILDDFDESLIFEDNRYLSTLENYIQTKDDIGKRQESFCNELNNLEENHASAESSYKTIFENLMAQEFAVAKKIKPRKSHSQDWINEVERLMENQRNRILDIKKIRLVYLQLHYRLEILQGRLREFDSLGPGLSMINYEYLMNKKRVYTEKCDEQREHIRKISEKNLSCAATIRHLNEEADLYNEKIKKEFESLNALLEKNKIERSKAVGIVEQRGQIFKNILKLKAEIGFLDSPYLIRKMEFDLREIERLKKLSEILQLKIHSAK